MRQNLVWVFFLLVSSAAFAAVSADKELQGLIDDFVPAYQKLEIPNLELGYADNFKKIQSLPRISDQKTFFLKYQRELKTINRETLSQNFKYQFDALKYQIALDLERVALERHYKEHEPSKIPAGGILQMPMGREWYFYYIKKWTSTRPNPVQLMKFGFSEATRIRAEMKKVQKDLGYEGKDLEFHLHLNGPEFLITDENELLERFIKFRSLIFDNLHMAFAQVTIPTVDFKPIPNPTKDSPPGYYDDGVFYYNFLNHSFPKRSLEWLFIHEAVPGHHFQGHVSPIASPLQKLFWYPGFSEGWGAYAEDLGKDLKAFTDPYEYYGKWEWDLVRSTRVVLDVGINYFGWTKAQALKVWRENIANQDSIAKREVDRMIRWPAQVLAYKVGERMFLKNQGALGDLKKFHSLVLDRGSIPLPILAEIIADSSKR